MCDCYRAPLPHLVRYLLNCLGSWCVTISNIFAHPSLNISLLCGWWQRCLNLSFPCPRSYKLRHSVGITVRIFYQNPAVNIYFNWQDLGGIWPAGDPRDCWWLDTRMVTAPSRSNEVVSAKSWRLNWKPRQVYANSKPGSDNRVWPMQGCLFGAEVFILTAPQLTRLLAEFSCGDLNGLGWLDSVRRHLQSKRIG